MPPKNKKNKKSGVRLWSEVLGILLAGCALFLLCSLVSYHPQDPSFENVQSAAPAQIHNWGKMAGAYCASLLFQILGLIAFAVPAGLLLLGLKVLFRPSFSLWLYVRTGLISLLLVCAATFLSLGLGRLDMARYQFDAGGALLGGMLATHLQRIIGTFGTVLLLVVVCLLIVMALTRISYVSLWHATSGQGTRLMMSLRRYLPRRLPSLPAGWLARRRKASGAPECTEADLTAETGVSDSESPEKTVYVQKSLFQEDIPITVYREECSEAGGGNDDGAFTPVAGKTARQYRLPSLGLLDTPAETSVELDRELLREDAETLMQKLADFGVNGRIVEISPGPVITRFEFEPASGVKLNRIVGLADDLALALKAISVRIAPIPGKSVVGIELPNKKRKVVSFKDIVSRPEFLDIPGRLTIGLGKDIGGGTVINDLSRMPHLLVAGTTGSGKSVFVNTVICSILFKATPDEVRFLMIDPKRLELFPYDGIPHLLHPVVVEPKKAAAALRWAVEEMDRRYRMLAERGTRDIVQYNKKVEKEREAAGSGGGAPEAMPYIVVVIDELADLMLIAARDVEGYIARLAQMARASGIHLLVATQRPSVDILTGVIKANFPSRISFQVSSKVDSRTILDTMGAEKLLGMGDMLFIPPGTSRLQRIHGAYISEKEITRVAEFIKKQGKPDYDETIVMVSESEAPEEQDEDQDELYDRAVAIVADTRQASISMLQRRMRVGYNRAARMIERMEREGVVGPSDGVRPRDVLVNKL